MADGLCRIHKELGFDAKPLVCRMFPLQIVPRDNVAYLTIRRACPSAAADKGRPVAEHLDSARQLGRASEIWPTPPPAPPPIKPGERASGESPADCWKRIQRLLTDERYPPVRRLVHGLILGRLVEKAHTRSLSDERLIELFERAGEKRRRRSGRPLFRAPAPQPGGAGAVSADGRRVCAAASGSRSQAGVGRAVAPGDGRLEVRARPRPAAAAASGVSRRRRSSSSNEPLGVLDPAIYQPLTRLIETAAVSWSYALANRGGWSIVESLRMLALTLSDRPMALAMALGRRRGEAGTHARDHHRPRPRPRLRPARRRQTAAPRAVAGPAGRVGATRCLVCTLTPTNSREQTCSRQPNGLSGTVECFGR